MTPGSILETPVVLAPETTVARSRIAETAFHWAEQILLGVAAIFYALHFLHLRADFPNRSPWTDWAKYTDEGWYGDAAIRHFQWGHWNVPGDFNPAAALPVWPLLEAAVFRVTGVSLVAARALAVVVFGLILLASYMLLRRWAATGPKRRSLAPALAVLLLATSPFCYAFTRIAILEPLLILFALCALLLAGRRRAKAKLMPRDAPVHSWPVLSLIGLGAVLTLLVLTKTTGLFLFPAILFALWGAADRSWKLFLRNAGIAGGTAAALWGAYFLFFVRPHYLADYKYLFSANTYTKITAETFWSVLQETLLDGTWMGDALFWSALIALTMWVVVGAVRRFRTPALPTALVSWVFGYAAFLAYHANLAPRYYTVIAVPLVLLLAMGFDSVLWAVWRGWRGREAGVTVVTWALRLVAAGSSITVLFILAGGARQTLSYATHPEYTFLTAVHHLNDAVRRELAADPHHPKLVLSTSGSDISLITGLPSIDDDFGTMELPDRVAAYKPGWFVAWNDMEDDKMAALAPMYRVVRVGAYPAYDDPLRNQLVLYRLDPADWPVRGRSGRRRYFINPHRRPAKPARAAATAR